MLYGPSQVPRPPRTAYTAWQGGQISETNSAAVWATTPRDGALWKIDPKTNEVTRITVPYLPTCVAAGEDDIWVTVRS